MDEKKMLVKMFLGIGSVVLILPFWQTNPHINTICKEERIICGFHEMYGIATKTCIKYAVGILTFILEHFFFFDFQLFQSSFLVTAMELALVDISLLDARLHELIKICKQYSFIENVTINSVEQIIITVEWKLDENHCHLLPN